MRRLNVANNNKALKVVKEFDAFPKVPDDYKKTTVSGGGLSILTFVIIGLLVISEYQYYSSTELKFDYQVDTQYSGKLQVNVDMTVAMKCDFIGADILDVTGQDTHSFGRLTLDPAYFDLSPKQKKYQSFIQEVNRYLQTEYHAVQELLWKTGGPNFRGGMPPREDKPDREPDSCRVHGSLEVNKVAGNFHITAGKVFRHAGMRGHKHMTPMLPPSDYNFSHRIDHLSFGEPIAGVVYPLDGEELVTINNYHMFQYFMKVVPTSVRTYTANVDTYQFAVTERNRSINHHEGSHGVPGIFVKYDLNSLKIQVREEHQPFWQFIVRMCGIVGGIFAVSGMLHDICGFIVDIICCRFKIAEEKNRKNTDLVNSVSQPLNSLVNQFPSHNIENNPLLSTQVQT
ncbi:hypothetical protein SNE40_006602 [Patella caerulea]|uniref:Endoplasmic reticulum-Golgi intermediate compartment protein 2 n=1 Tax=Patella caerulea TaxID=87958 RepID=A0AAN8PTT6_PATCE